jgi:hypothetical protein
MATADGCRLTQRQRLVADTVCEHARTLVERVRILARLVWTDTVTRADGLAVYGWLVELDLSDQLAGVRTAGGAS